MRAMIVAAAVCVAGCGGGDVSPPMSTAQAQGAPQVFIEDLHAILRPDSGGRWYVQTDWGPRVDPDHASAGVSWSVEQTNEFIRLHFLKTYTHAGVIQVSSDDDFGGRVRGYSNLGLSSATIRVEVDGQRIDPGRILEYVPNAAQAGNFWVSVRMITKR